MGLYVPLHKDRRMSGHVTQCSSDGRHFLLSILTLADTLTQWHHIQSQTFFLLEMLSLRLCSRRGTKNICTAEDSCITKQIVTAYAHSISVTLYNVHILRFHPVVRARRGNPAHRKLRHVSRDFGPVSELLDDGRRN